MNVRDRSIMELTGVKFSVWLDKEISFLEHHDGSEFTFTKERLIRIRDTVKAVVEELKQGPTLVDKAKMLTERARGVSGK